MGYCIDCKYLDTKRTAPDQITDAVCMLTLEDWCDKQKCVTSWCDKFKSKDEIEDEEY